MTGKKGLNKENLKDLEEELFIEFSILKDEEGLNVSNKNEISKMIYSIIGDHLPHPGLKEINVGNYLYLMDNLYEKFN